MTFNAVVRRAAEGDLEAIEDGEAKFWVEPRIELAENFGLPERELGRIQELVERHEHEIREAWKRHFASDR